MNSLTSAPTTASELVIFKDVIIYSDIPCNKIILLISNLFKEYINISDNMYSMVSMFSYDLIVKLIYKLEEFGFGTGNVSFNFSSVNFEDKIRLLEEGFSDETIIKLIDDFDVNAKSHFFLNDKRAIYLYKKVNPKDSPR